MMSDAPVLCWLRRDLRLKDNLALHTALKTGQPVIPVFIFDPAILRSKRLAVPRLKFMLDALIALDAELRKQGARLIIRRGDPVVELGRLITDSGASHLFFNADYTPYARQRDEAVQRAIDIPAYAFHDRMLVPPGALVKSDGQPYIVYTPFRNRWREIGKPTPLENNNSHWRWYDQPHLNSDPIPSLQQFGFGDTIPVPEASETQAHHLLGNFLAEAVYQYKTARNYLGNPSSTPRTATSALSPYIRFGLLSLRHIYWAAREAYAYAPTTDARESVTAFVDEIIWHEFYTHILYHFPYVKTRNFNTRYDAVPWLEPDAAFDAWKEGRTGYPVIDAAMRQLRATGWMHNRARMIVASFLTKDLLIDWRLGELYFMQRLVDGDLAANNGGWQWAAGTGTDAQPYFRIFNPVSQSKKFDNDGAFIRSWIPELRDVPDQYIHEPWTMPQPPAAYPAPIIDHAFARDRTLKAFASSTER